MLHSKIIYLDYAATTPVEHSIAEEMMKYLTFEGDFANPASRSHRLGWHAETAVEIARGQVAELINAHALDIVWTSGATEATNLALKGISLQLQDNEHTPHIVSSIIEHKATLDSLTELHNCGCQVTLLTPEKMTGVVSSESVEQALQKNTILVSLMLINNEIGSINDIKAISAVIKKFNTAHGVNILLHVDAAQAAGKMKIDVNALGIDLMSLSAHKVYGPKGIGVLYVRHDLPIKPKAQIHGGGHERGMRSGTLATHQIVGMGLACEIAKEKLAIDISHYQELRDLFWSELQHIKGVQLNGKIETSIANIINVSFSQKNSEEMMLAMSNLAVSSGSACNSQTVEPSFVLRGIGVSDERAHRAIRFSFGRFTTKENIKQALDMINSAI